MAHPILQCHLSCVFSFERLCTTCQTSSQIHCDQMPPWKLYDAYGRYKSWAASIGANQDGRKSLDYRLAEDNTSTKALLLNMQKFLSETLDDSASIMNGSRLPFDELHPDSESSDDEDLESAPEARTLPQRETELQELLYSVESTVNSLYALSTVIRQKPPSYYRYLKFSQTSLPEWDQIDLQHIRDKFPQAEQWLVARMGTASSKRRQYLKYMEEHMEKISQTFEEVTITHPGTMDYTPSGVRPDVRLNVSGNTIAKNRMMQPRDSNSIDHFTAASTDYSQHFATILAEFNLRNDEAETTSQSSCASSITENEGLIIPSAPKTSQGGACFTCPYCHEPCRLDGRSEERRRRQWKAHIFEDLQPYQCTVRDCGQAKITMYDNQRDWWAHECQVHRTEWCCNTNGHGAFTQAREFLKHIDEQHSDLANELKSFDLIALFGRPLDRATSACEFCASEDTSALSATQLQHHLARHLEALALRVLPRSDTGDHEDYPSDSRSDGGTENSEKLQSGFSIAIDRRHCNAIEETREDTVDNRKTIGTSSLSMSAALRRAASQASGIIEGLSPEATYEYWCNELDAIWHFSHDLDVMWHYGPQLRFFIKMLLGFLSMSMHPVCAEDLIQFNKSPWSITTVLEMCSRLIKVTPFTTAEASKHHVKLVHPSLRYYVFSHDIHETRARASAFGSNEQDMQRGMANSCLGEILKDRTPLLKSWLPTFKMDSSYAAKFWFLHARDLNDVGYAEADVLKSAMAQLFTSERAFSFWLSLYDPETGGSRQHADHPSPLYYAALLGFPHLVHALLAQGADPNSVGGRFQNPLMAAIHTSPHTETRVCMDPRARSYGQHRLEYENLTETRLLAKQRSVSSLLEKGANPSSTDGQGYNALDLAVQQGYANMVTALIQYGADIDCKDSKGRTTLFTAIKANRTDILQLLAVKGADMAAFDADHLTLLACATKMHSIQVMRLLLSANIDVEVKDSHGKTALHFATKSLFLEGLQLLIAWGADVEAKDRNGRTPLHYAALFCKADCDLQNPGQNRTAIMKLLMDGGANRETFDDFGMTPLDYERRRAQTQSTKNNAIHDARDLEGEKPAPSELIPETESQSATTGRGMALNFCKGVELIFKKDCEWSFCKDLECEDDGGDGEPSRKRAKTNTIEHADVHLLGSSLSSESTVDRLQPSCRDARQTLELTASSISPEEQHPATSDLNKISKTPQRSPSGEE